MLIPVCREPLHILRSRHKCVRIGVFYGPHELSNVLDAVLLREFTYLGVCERS